MTLKYHDMMDDSIVTLMDGSQLLCQVVYDIVTLYCDCQVVYDIVTLYRSTDDSGVSETS